MVHDLNHNLITVTQVPSHEKPFFILGWQIYEFYLFFLSLKLFYCSCPLICLNSKVHLNRSIARGSGTIC